MKDLQAVNEHGAVVLLEYVGADLNAEVACHAEDIRIERAVVKRAECHSVRDDGFTKRVPIREYVRGFEQFLVTQAANGAVPLVRLDNTKAKRRLMRALL